MRIITDKECGKLIEEGAGFCDFMGGVSSKDKRMILAVEGILYYFEDRNDPEYKRIWAEQCEEGKRFINECNQISG